MSDLADRSPSSARASRMPRATPGASPSEITRIVVTKFQPASLVRELAALGVLRLRREPAPGGGGEGGGARRPRPDLALRRPAAEQEGAAGASHTPRVVHSVDREALVTRCAPTRSIRRLLRAGRPQRRARTRRSAALEVPGLAEHVLADTRAAPRRRHGGRAARRARRGRVRRPPRWCPSASASVASGRPPRSPQACPDDFREAILEGATHLRIGTAITGNRPVPRLTSKRRKIRGG